VRPPGLAGYLPCYPGEILIGNMPSALVTLDAVSNMLSNMSRAGDWVAMAGGTGHWNALAGLL
jgi:hypothetical protein